jgi:flagellar basal-body rod protein FlgF
VDKLIYVAMTGAAHIDRAQALHANNLANVATTGFRADLEQARSVQIYGDGYKGRVYALTERPGNDFDQGAMVQTGRDLDVAVNGPGFLAVQTPDGKEAYSRDGGFKVDELGNLRDTHGRPVLGDGGPIVLPPYDRLTIGADGSITIQPEGQAPDALVQIDRLKLVKPATGAVEKGTDGLFHATNGTKLPSSPDVTVTAGALEGSNVNAVDEMASILTLARQFDLEVRLMKSAEQNDEAASALLRVN